jgi:hypothetical protein
LKRKWFWALFLSTAASWPSAGIIEANGAHVHIGGLSGGASLALILIALAVAGLFVALFVLRWRQSARPSMEWNREDDPDQPRDFKDPDEG